MGYVHWAGAASGWGGASVQPLVIRIRVNIGADLSITGYSVGLGDSHSGTGP